MPSTETGLADLPTELIHQIISSLPSDACKKDLRSLCLTSRRLRSIAEEHLYASFSFTPRFTPRSTKKFSNRLSRPFKVDSDEITHHLFRTLTERPELRSWAKSLTHKAEDNWGAAQDKQIDRLILAAPEAANIPHLQILRYGRGRGDRDVAAAHLLLLLPNLRDLSILIDETYDWDDGEYKGSAIPYSHVLEMLNFAGVSSSIPGFHGFPLLTNLDLSFRERGPDEVVDGRFLLIPSLRKVRLHGVAFKQDWKCPPYSSPVTDLGLDAHKLFPYHKEGFITILKSFAHLRALCWENCLREPSFILSVLEVQKHALETIELWTGEANVGQSDSWTYTSETLDENPVPQAFSALYTYPKWKSLLLILRLQST
ncbi:hypothetical protein K505DRAFT_343771 [Melanomma pulvis-pyrius CBS 109.77]|uniref:F-box domain-containing protein n=1 Tax=Melanomma pulvis-pyrius CBS 109.77 TaxID=1314802 RepID=A0A6A6WQW0_9PLEO|nr:hypothetical protein K505DRAFT_343771 [Melanomma pulvis-pyrius CBS 109.77]